MHKWTEEEKAYLKEVTPGHHYSEIRDLINQKFHTDLTVNQIRAAIKNHKLNTRLTGYYDKGHNPWNKGLKGINFGGQETQFKKGNRPHNWVPIGSERITKDGYVQVKVQEGKFQHNWKGKHVLIWEEHNGPLPEGHAIIFGDGDTRNFDINNLILVSRQELLIMNKQGLVKNDAELTKAGAMVAKLQSKMYQKLKGE